MLLSIITILAGIITIVFLLLTKICSEWYDFWMILVTFIVAWIISALIIVILIFLYTLTVNKKKEYDKPNKFMRFLIKIVCEMLLQIFRVDVNVRGLEKVPEDQAVFLVQNHNSYIDPLITIWTFRFLDIVFIMKKEIMKAPFVSHALYRCGFPALDRQNNREALKTMVKTKEMVEKGIHSVGVYPEGTRSKDGELHEFKAGSFKIPEKTGCPVVVTVLKNTDKILKRFPFKKTQVYIDVIDVLYADDYLGENTPELSESIHKMMKDRLEELKELDK